MRHAAGNGLGLAQSFLLRLAAQRLNAKPTVDHFILTEDQRPGRATAVGTFELAFEAAAATVYLQAQARHSIAQAFTEHDRGCIPVPFLAM